MEHMFHGASAFNQPLNDWRVDNVRNMMAMFCGASSFNQPIGGWRVNNVTDMRWMFRDASAFDQPLGNWGLKCDCGTDRMFDENFQNSRPVKESCCAIS